MTNSPEMVVTAYALSKLGAVGALINVNLRGNENTTLVLGGFLISCNR